MLGNSYCALCATKSIQHTFEEGWKLGNKTVVNN